MTELLLMFAARAQHIEQVIEPALAQGHWVLSDRFTDASFAYQGGGRQMGAATVAAVAQLVHPNLTPDLTLYFDLPVEAGQARIANRQLDRLEREAIDFFERVRSTYRERAAAEPARFVLVDAAQDEVSVGADACRILSDAIDRWQTQSG